jgi:hypothetical protein
MGLTRSCRRSVSTATRWVLQLFGEAQRPFEAARADVVRPLMDAPAAADVRR